MTDIARAGFVREKPDTHTKALRINLDHRRYGTFAEIGAGQEVVRWFFRVGGAAGTVAKSMSAYDMTVSDAIYGPCERYVSRPRLESMLAHEQRLNVDRLMDKRGDTTAFFTFANTVSAKSFKGGNRDCHGWLGVRYQLYPRDQDSQIIIHIRLLDTENLLQQEALGVVGVNLLYGAFYHHHEPEVLVESLLDNLSTSRIEIDMIELSGIGFRMVDNRVMSLKLVQLGLSKAAMFDSNGKVLQPSEFFYKKNILLERGSFRPVTHVNLDMIRCAHEKFAAELPPEERDQIVTITELTMSNLQQTNTGSSYSDFLARADTLAACGMTTIISDYFEYYRMVGFLTQHSAKRVALVMGVPSLKDLFDSKYYQHLDGGILESFGRLFKFDLKIYVYPFFNREDGEIINLDNFRVDHEVRNLFKYLMDRGVMVQLDNYKEEYLHIFSREVLQLIAKGIHTWEDMVPNAVAKLIKDRGLLGYNKGQDK